MPAAGATATRPVLKLNPVAMPTENTEVSPAEESFSGDVTPVRSHHDVLEWAGSTAPFSQLLNQIPNHATREKPLLFEHVAGPAHAFVCAMIAARLDQFSAGHRLWILAKDLRLQENLFNELTTWWGRERAQFFPEQEINHYVDALPDPDIAAYKLPRS